MHQSALALAATAAGGPAPEDATGFQIGWDHAQHGLAPAPELLLDGSAVGQGWRAARAVLGRRPTTSTHALRQWLALRCTAWRDGVTFDLAGLTPAALVRLQVSHCPVRRMPLGGAPAGSDAPQWARLDRKLGYQPGNVVLFSRAAAVAAQDCSVQQALRQARAADACGTAAPGLQAAQWRRLAVLLSFAQPLPLHEAARLPLLVLPPPGLAPRSTAQALQWRLTLNFASAGWSQRARRLAATLPQDAQRTEFHLLVSALASRLLQARSDPLTARGGNGQPDTGQTLAPSQLEDAWLHERVLRRWQQLALGLGEATAQALQQQAAALCAQPGRQPREPARRGVGTPSGPAGTPLFERGREQGPGRRPASDLPAALPCAPGTAPTDVARAASWPGTGARRTPLAAPQRPA